MEGGRGGRERIAWLQCIACKYTLARVATEGEREGWRED